MRERGKGVFNTVGTGKDGASTLSMEESADTCNSAPRPSRPSIWSGKKLGRGPSWSTAGSCVLPREEHGIAQPILPGPQRIIPRRIEVLPHTRGIDVLVPLIPAAVDDFGQARVVVVAFEVGVREAGGGGGFALGGKLSVSGEVGGGGIVGGRWC